MANKQFYVVQEQDLHKNALSRKICQTKTNQNYVPFGLVTIAQLQQNVDVCEFCLCMMDDQKIAIHHKSRPHYHQCFDCESSFVFETNYENHKDKCKYYQDIRQVLKDRKKAKHIKSGTIKNLQITG